MAPNGDATDLADAFGVIGPRNRRGVFLEGGELMELQDCASEDEATMGKLRGLCSGMDLELAFFIDAILENRIVGEGEGIAVKSNSRATREVQRARKRATRRRSLRRAGSRG